MADPNTNRPTSKFWSVIGGLSGGALGFIMANVPGLIGGAVAGNRLGAVRDAKGKSVYSVFQVSFDARLSLGSAEASFGAHRTGSCRRCSRVDRWLTVS
jgi:hypothetical protein